MTNGIEHDTSKMVASCYMDFLIWYKPPQDYKKNEYMRSYTPKSFENTSNASDSPFDISDKASNAANSNQDVHKKMESYMQKQMDMMKRDYRK